MAATGLIGYTGFVGQHLLQSSQPFDLLYNTKNIQEIRGQAFDLLVCAAPQAKKWWANQNPAADWEMIAALIADLQQTQAETFVLLSSVDVFPQIVGVDESFDCASQPNHAYGQHRFQLEQAVANHFPKAHIVRLPGLFGAGLKKNVIFDMINHNQVEKINPNSQFQWYDLSDLWSDLKRIMQAQLALVMLATEPIYTRDIHQRFFPDLDIGAEAGGTARYDVQTQYAAVWGESGAYIRSKTQMMDRLAQFIEAETGNVS